MQSVYSILLGAMVCLALAGCRNDKKIQGGAVRSEALESQAASKADRAQPPAESAGEKSEAQLSDPLRGVVRETLGSGGYTYLLLATERGDIWAAARTFAVAVGDEVEIAGLSAMRDFRSPTLGRVFEEIEFAGSAKLIGGSATPDHASAQTLDAILPPGHPPLGGDVAAQPKRDQRSGKKAGPIKKLPDGVTVAELFAKKAVLAGKIVRFRGRVVKVSRNILGSNWLHIQDGSGEPGSNDMTVTSKKDFATVGSIVVIEGTLGVDKDFGAGYSYEVIVEDAKVVPDEGYLDGA